MLRQKKQKMYEVEGEDGNGSGHLQNENITPSSPQKGKVMFSAKNASLRKLSCKSKCSKVASSNFQEIRECNSYVLTGVYYCFIFTEWKILVNKEEKAGFRNEGTTFY